MSTWKERFELYQCRIFFTAFTLLVSHIFFHIWKLRTLMDIYINILMHGSYVMHLQSIPAALYVTSQLRHSLAVHPLPRKILDPSLYDKNHSTTKTPLKLWPGVRNAKPICHKLIIFTSEILHVL